MLAILGGVVFEIAPINVTAIEHSSEARFAEKPILGRRPPLEFIGDGAETFGLTVKLLPYEFGGLDGLSNLAAMRQSGIAQYFMRGDGVPMGWFVIEKVSERSSYLSAQGIGRVVDVDISIKRADAPVGSDFFASIMGML
ncbi:phage tail protein [Kaistia sp. UC242_56]|uniref:phage tail protein n=1 Tax=Kaistia sp. UC242_56 TaxID=3374625 RepID=UPI00379D8D72